MQGISLDEENTLPLENMVLSLEKDLKENFTTMPTTLILKSNFTLKFEVAGQLIKINININLIDQNHKSLL